MCSVKGWAKRVFLSVLLLWSLLAGQCVLCQHAQASQPSSHDCCPPAKPDTCHAPDAQNQCPGHDQAFESYSKVEPPTPAGTVEPACEPVVATLAEPNLVAAHGLRGEHAQPPPLDRLLFTTVLLI